VGLDERVSTALLTDHYELTMVSAALRDGTADRQCVYGVVAGTGRLIDAIAAFRFAGPEVDFLLERGVVDEQTAAWLAAYEFRGDIDGYAEGELFFPGSPILTVSGTFVDCVVLETLVLSVLNHDCAVGAAAARMVTAARGRPLIEMGSRRAHEQGIRNAIAVAGPGLGAIRIDSGDLSVLAAQSRQLLDSLGAVDTRIVVSGDLDEYAIAALAAEPVDAYGAGTAVVTGSGAPTAGLVYKLVEVDGRPVVKRSEHKATVGGRKTAVRRHKPTGTAIEEIVVSQGAPEAQPYDRELQRPFLRAGRPVPDLPTLDESREQMRQSLISIPWEGLKLSAGDPAIPVLMQGGSS
jgi:nicotinate phosphoribosyltransferase